MAGITWWTARRMAYVSRLAAEGYTTAEIAKQVSRRYRRRVSARAVRHVCRRHGITLRYGRGDARWRPDS